MSEIQRKERTYKSNGKSTKVEAIGSSQLQFRTPGFVGNGTSDQMIPKTSSAAGSSESVSSPTNDDHQSTPLKDPHTKNNYSENLSQSTEKTEFSNNKQTSKGATEEEAEQLLEEKVLRLLKDVSISTEVEHSADANHLEETMKKLELVLRKERNISDIIEDVLEIAYNVANKSTNVVLTLNILKSACCLAVNKVAEDKALSILESCTTIFETISLDLQFQRGPAMSQASEDVIKVIESLRNMTIELPKVKKLDKLKVHVSYVLCLATFKLSVKYCNDGNKDCDEAIELLKDNFGKKVKKMSLYGEACKLKFCFLHEEGHHQKAETFLQESLNIFYFINTSSPNETSIRQLYGTITFIGASRRQPTKLDLEKKVFTKIEARAQHQYLDDEAVVLQLSLVWLSSLTGKKDSFKRNLQALKEMTLEMPSANLLLIVCCLTCNVIAKLPTDDPVEPKMKIVNYARDMCLLVKNVYKKFYLLNLLVQCTMYNNIGIMPHPDVCSSFLSSVFNELQTMNLLTTCPWMYHRYCLSIKSACYFYVITAQNNTAIQNLEKFFRIASSYPAKYHERFEVLKTCAHYLAAFVYFKTLDFPNAKRHLDEELKVLIRLNLPNVHRMDDAMEHRIFVQKLLVLPRHELGPIPKGLMRLCSYCLFIDRDFEPVIF